MAASPVEIERVAIPADAHLACDAVSATMALFGLLTDMEGKQLRVLDIEPEALARMPRPEKPTFAMAETARPYPHLGPTALG